MSCSGRPPSVTCSVASSICAGIGNCGMPDSSARIAGTARTGSALLSLGGKPVGVELPRRQRHAQQGRRAEADIAVARPVSARALGAIVDLDLIEPCAGVIGLMTRVAIRQGCCSASFWPAAAWPATPRAPNRGACASKASTPSRSAASARSPGSILRWTRAAVAVGVCPEEIRNG